ncbi:MAG TPA: protein kinase [Pyrinomonadaceae bacterium]|nr:protein kinase [Pyrinomonadaceae bacterium]
MSSTDAERWQAVKDLFSAALACSPEERARFLDRACAGDEGLRREVESLLAYDEEAKSFMETPAVAGAAESLIQLETRLAVGQQISHYQIASVIGRGGMGEVYLAKDISLGRHVAIKMLPQQFIADADRLRRFKQEAQTASSLNHPNIITIYEIGRHEQDHFIAMEFIDGLTLRRKLASGPLPLTDALDIAYQVAMALTAAHEANVIHRDIKPENIMLRRDRFVKVLDFGLAKLSETTAPSLDSAMPTRAPGTEPGRVIGTVSYMSPEQTRGLEVDARTDIWSLGVLLYEMVTGSAPFTGETASHIAVAILENDPVPVSLIAKHAPSELQRIVRKSLAKDRDERYQTARDLLIDLKNLRQDLTGTVMHRAETDAKVVSQEHDKRTGEIHTANTTSNAVLPSRKSVLRGAGLTAVLLTATVAAYWYFLRPRPSTPLPSLTVIPLTTDPGFEGMPSLSPDGNYVAFIAGAQQKDFDLYVKQIGGGPPSRLTSGPAVEQFPAWSPDNRSIAFIRPKRDKLEVLLISPFGGPERKVAEITADTSTGIFSWAPPYLCWTPDSNYLVTMDRLSPEEPYGLFAVSVATGEKQRLTTPTTTTTADGNPAISPDGRTLAFVRVVGEGNTQVCVLPLSENYRPAGEPRRLNLPQQFLTSPAWTLDGQEIVYSASEAWATGEWRLWRVARTGVEKPQPLATVGENGTQATISRQGHRLVYADWKYDSDIWQADVNGPGKSSPAVKLISSTRRDDTPHYSPDGSKIAFTSDRSGQAEIWVCNSNGSDPVQLTTLQAFSGSAQWFPDGRRIVFDLRREGQSDIYVTDMESRVPHRLTNDASDDVEPSVSHDGRSIYFSSKRTGRFELWRMPAEGGEARQVTHNGGAMPIESSDGKAIYYAKAPGETEVWKVPVSGGDETRVFGPVVSIHFAVAVDGIYFIEIGTPVYAGSRGNSLKFYPFATGVAEKVADITLDPATLSVSPDGRHILMTLIDPFVCDLKLVENFQ